MRVDDLEDVPAGNVGRRLVAALAAKDAASLRALFDDDVDFRALTPGKAWEAGTAAVVVDDVILGTWFDPGDTIERVESVEAGMVEDRHRLSYRLGVSNADGRFVVEQQAFLDIADGKITRIRVLCSGFRPVAGA